MEAAQVVAHARVSRQWLAVMASVLAHVALRQAGLLVPGALLALLALVLLEVGAALLALIRRRVTPAGFRERTFWLSLLVTQLLAAALAVAVHWGTFVLDIPPGERSSFSLQLALLALLPALARLVPRLSPSPRLPLAQAALGLLMLGELVWSARPLPVAVELASPFPGAALVVHGGPSPLTNHHAHAPSQEHALDLLSDGPRGPHDCLGVALRAPLSGEITAVVDHLPEGSRGGASVLEPAGNHVVIAAAPGGPYVLLAHLQAGSVLARVGQRVRRGEALARCGNSGNSTRPHLHLQAQNKPRFDVMDPELSTLPIRFIGVVRIRAGVEAQGSLSMRRNDVFVPLGKPQK